MQALRAPQRVDENNNENHNENDDEDHNGNDDEDHNGNDDEDHNENDGSYAVLKLHQMKNGSIRPPSW